MPAGATLNNKPWRIIRDRIDQVYSVPNTFTNTLAVFQMVNGAALPTTTPFASPAAQAGTGGSVARFRGTIFAIMYSNTQQQMLGFWDVDFTVETIFYSGALVGTAPVGSGVLPSAQAMTQSDAGLSGTLTVDVSTPGEVHFQVGGLAGTAGLFGKIVFAVDVTEWAIL